MRPGVFVAGLCAGVIAGGIALSVKPVGAQSFGGSQSPLRDVQVTNRVDVSATTPPGTWLGVAGDENGARLEVAVPNGVVVSGTVELGAASQALLAGRVCTYGPTGHQLIDGGVHTIPGMVGRTGVQLVAHDFGALVDYVSCWPGQPDGGDSPNCTLGDAGVGMAIHERGSTTFDVSNAYVIRCTTCSHTGGGGATTAIVSGANSQCTP